MLQKVLQHTLYWPVACVCPFRGYPRRKCAFACNTGVVELLSIGFIT